MMDEYTLDDIDRWLAVFPLDEVPVQYQVGAGITGPEDLAKLEQMRARAASQYDLGRRVPTDVFVFAKGEPSRRDVTKVGGQPYRPTGKAWPTTPKGEPLTFLAQYRFVESRDITGDLPGDLLLVFVRDDQALLEDNPEWFAFEWYPLGLKDLARNSEQPKPSWRFPICYGVRHRTVDYVEQQAVELIMRSLPNQVKTGALTADDAMYAAQRGAGPIATIAGMKIGGVPFWQEPEYIRPEIDLPGKFLCSLSTIMLDSFGPYPWINHPEPFSEHERKANIDDWLDVMDGFVLNFSIDESNQLHWLIQAGF